MDRTRVGSRTYNGASAEPVAQASVSTWLTLPIARVEQIECAKAVCTT